MFNYLIILLIFRSLPTVYACQKIIMHFLQIQRPETEPTKLGVPINGTSYKHMNDSMSSSCTLPSGMTSMHSLPSLFRMYFNTSGKVSL